MSTLIDTFVEKFSIEALTDFFRKASKNFKKEQESFDYILKNKEEYASFSNLQKVGSIAFKDADELIIFTCSYNGELSERSSKKKQYDIAKTILKNDFKDGAIFVFYDQTGKFRFSFIKKNWGEKGANKYTSWKRFTFFVKPEETNKTFKKRLTECSFKDLKSVEEAFSVEALTKDFYNDLFKWYTWVLTDKVGITFPNDTKTSDDDRVRLEEQIIRLITRMLFVWFIKQKHLVPNELFEIEKLNTLLKDFEPQSVTSGNYYNAILQNLFFATLNKPILEREFAKLVDKRDIKARYRYAEMFQISEEEILTLFRPVPFLNGGLFECLDKELSTDGVKYHLDGFSRNAEKAKNGNFKHRAFIPNSVFFGDGTNEGLLPLLERYNFTVEENVPNEMEVALDPELLGNVFENLLGAFNPETKDSARKQSGSFYTPKEIVAYMADESLISYLENNLPEVDKLLIRSIFEEETLSVSLQNDFELCKKIENELRKVKILDPACGSGAFPMGVLNRLVEILEKLDVQNKQSHYDLKLHLIQECIYGVDIQTIASQISKLRFFISLIVEQEKVDYTKPEENYGVWTLPNLETKFVTANTLIGLEDKQEIHLLDLKDEHLQKLQEQLLKIREEHFYAKSASKKVELRKQDEDLRAKIVDYLTQNSTKPNEELIKQNLIQIENLRQQRKKYEAENWIDDFPVQVQGTLFDDEFPKQQQLFRTDLNAEPRRKIDDEINSLQNEIKKEQKKSIKVGFEGVVQKVSQWNPYDQNASSPFFDMKWMFGVEEGFDIVIGNPPYIKEYDNRKAFDEFRNSEFYLGKMDIWYGFTSIGLNLLRQNGVLSFIAQNNWITSAGAKKLRKDILTRTKIKQFIDFGNYKVFDSAGIQTMIFLLQKTNDNLEYPMKYSLLQNDKIDRKELKSFLDFNTKNEFESNKFVFHFKSEKFKDKTINFTNSEIDELLDKIENKGAFKLDDSEVAQGIVAPQDFVNNASLPQLKSDKIKKGDGIFVLNQKELDNLNLSNSERELIKPYFTSEELTKYFTIRESSKWIIYTNSKFKNTKLMEKYPNIKKHLDKFKDIITSDNKPYGLHRAREQRFFTDTKIMSLRKCKEPTFTLTEGECYVSQSYFIIKTKRIDLKYLTAFLNSNVIKFWLRFKGKMQGQNFQIDKVPLMNIPIAISEFESEIIEMFNDIENNIHRIDKLLYKTYGFTTEEVDLLENHLLK